MSNKIINLDIANYKEESLFEIKPDKNYKKFCGIHTINYSNNIVIFDAKKLKFVPYKILINISRKVIKIFH